MISYQNAEDALSYLLSTDEEYARTKTLYDALCEQKKTIAALEYGKLSGSAAEKNQQALASDNYQSHLRAIRDAQIEFETVRAVRISKQALIEMWRSINSARNKGNI